MKSIGLVFGLFILFACEHRLTSNELLAKRLSDEINSGLEVIKLGKIMNFDWESVIILTPYSLPKTTENKHDIDLTSIKHIKIEERDDINLIVFLRGNEPFEIIEYPRYLGDFSENGIKIIQKHDANYEVISTDEKSMNGRQWIRLLKK